MPRIRSGYVVPLLMCCLPSTAALGNGINPPRPSGSRTVEAQCTDRNNGAIITLQRARLTTDEASPMIELRIGDAPASTLQLAQVAGIRMPSARPKPDGFVKATLELREPDYQGPGFVRVRIDGKPVQLTGFNAELARVTIPLENCRLLALAASTPAPAAERPAAKK